MKRLLSKSAMVLSEAAIACVASNSRSEDAIRTQASFTDLLSNQVRANAQKKAMARLIESEPSPSNKTEEDEVKSIATANQLDRARRRFEIIPTPPSTASVKLAGSGAELIVSTPFDGLNVAEYPAASTTTLAKFPLSDAKS